MHICKKHAPRAPTISPGREDVGFACKWKYAHVPYFRISVFPNTKKGRWRCFKYLADCAKTPGANNPNRFRHLFRGFSAPGASKVITRGDLNEDFGPNLKSMLSFRMVCLNYPTGQRRLRVDSGHPRLGSETWDFMRYPLGRDLTSTTSL